jgi:hypothetical protein
VFILREFFLKRLTRNPANRTLAWPRRYFSVAGITNNHKDLREIRSGYLRGLAMISKLSLMLTVRVAASGSATRYMSPRMRSAESVNFT